MNNQEFRKLTTHQIFGYINKLEEVNRQTRETIECLEQDLEAQCWINIGLKNDINNNCVLGKKDCSSCARKRLVLNKNN